MRGVLRAPQALEAPENREVKRRLAEAVAAVRGKPSGSNGNGNGGGLFAGLGNLLGGNGNGNGNGEHAHSPATALADCRHWAMQVRGTEARHGGEACDGGVLQSMQA